MLIGVFQVFVGIPKVCWFCTFHQKTVWFTVILTTYNHTFLGTKMFLYQGTETKMMFLSPGGIYSFPGG